MKPVLDGWYGHKVRGVQRENGVYHLSYHSRFFVDFFLQLFLQADVPSESRTRLVSYLDKARKVNMPVYWTDDDVTSHRVRALCHLVLTLPEFQLD